MLHKYKCIYVYMLRDVEVRYLMTIYCPLAAGGVVSRCQLSSLFCMLHGGLVNLNVAWGDSPRLPPCPVWVRMRGRRIVCFVGVGCGLAPVCRVHQVVWCGFAATSYSLHGRQSSVTAESAQWSAQFQ